MQISPRFRFRTNNKTSFQKEKGGGKKEERSWSLQHLATQTKRMKIEKIVVVATSPIVSQQKEEKKKKKDRLVSAHLATQTNPNNSSQIISG
mmetsp:Transcript_30005/g.46471  ORF Transcript_30005/g.46471 Transcript_30005/m.46471 type:complete len:92 (-) Transcript_30005:304-579(-)